MVFNGLRIVLLLAVVAATTYELRAQIRVSIPDTIYIGVTRIGACDTVRIPIRNNGSSPIRRRSRQLVPATPGLRLGGPPEDPLEIAPGSVGTVPILFCPVDDSCRLSRVLLEVVESESGDRAEHEIVVRSCGGRILSEVSPALLDFDRVNLLDCGIRRIVLRNRGTYPMRIDRLDLDHPAFSIADPPPIPTTLLSGDSVAISVRFCPTTTGVLVDSLRVVSSGTTVATVFAYGTGVDELIPRFAADTIRLDSLLLGLCSTDTVTVVNPTDQPLVVRLPTTLPPIEVDPNLFPMRLEPGETRSVPVAVCPVDSGTFTELLRLETDTLFHFDRRYVGVGVEASLKLDTVRASVGSVVTLRLSAEPMSLLKRVEPRTATKIDVRFDRRALSLAPSDEAVDVIASTLDAGHVRLRSEAPGMLTDPSGYLHLRGLIAGRSSNVVTLVDGRYLDDRIRWRLDPGLVLLDGCDLGSIDSLGRPASIQAVVPNPARGAVILQLQIPRDRSAVLTVVDQTGRSLVRYEIPAGPSSSTSVELDTRTLPTGRYYLQLDERNVRHIRQLIVE